ncbi:MAG: 4-hydroxy-3-methylbut-2-enyl diphosphate reductase [Thermodesulfobacteriota bacterium]|nr:4-hydroxy-3-methylbut-2-enyl diphosphate reductase [Thermodesulfobacteriota bacterium]
MNVRLARTSGFCMGVKGAVDIAIKAGTNSPERIYTDGPLIHNPQVVKELEKKNIYPLKDISLIDKDSIVIIRSHGISVDRIDLLKEKGVKVLDATCPRVKNLHEIVKKYAKKKYTIVIIGQKEHPEVQGVCGYLKDNFYVVDSPDEAEKLFLPDNVCVASQTTQNLENFNKIVSIIREKSKNAEIFNTICPTTKKRQEELAMLAKECDVLVVVGGKNSGNTKRLYEIAQKSGKPSFFIETYNELKEEDFKNFNTAGVIGGASTPDRIIKDVVNRLSSFKSKEY